MQELGQHITFRIFRLFSAVQVWNPDDWEMFSLDLLQNRHGVLNVCKIPAKHKGDFGLDYYCPKDAVAYQCYSVEEPTDIATRANRQKDKITTDLGKLLKNQKEIGKLFLGVPIKHWVLLAPLHDSKELNLHCSKKTNDLRKTGCSVLDEQFEVGIHDQSSFPAGSIQAGLQNIAEVKLSVPIPTQEELSAWQAGSTALLANATHKLGKVTDPDDLEGAVEEAASSFLQGSALIDILRDGSPDMHDRIISIVNRRSRRLQLVGTSQTSPASMVLGDELDFIIDALRNEVPSLSTDNAEQIAYGVIYEWIMRCPLDFPDV